MRYLDLQEKYLLKCIECGVDFFTEGGEKEFYKRKGLYMPKRCKKNVELKESKHTKKGRDIKR